MPAAVIPATVTAQLYRRKAWRLARLPAQVVPGSNDAPAPVHGCDDFQLRFCSGGYSMNSHMTRIHGKSAKGRNRMNTLLFAEATSCGEPPHAPGGYSAHFQRASIQCRFTGVMIARRN